MTTAQLLRYFEWAYVVGCVVFMAYQWHIANKNRREEFERFKASIQEDRRKARIEAEREAHLSRVQD